jgi:hypothetical protein
MNQKDLASALERLLSERLGETPVTEPGDPLGPFRKAMHRIRKGLTRQPGVSAQIARHEQRITRIRALPPHVQELLRRYYVFLEAEENICFSMGLPAEEFRRLRREASDYILSRRDRKPEFEPRPRTSRGGS